MEIKCTPEELKQLIEKEPCFNKAQKEITLNNIVNDFLNDFRKNGSSAKELLRSVEI